MKRRWFLRQGACAGVGLAVGTALRPSAYMRGRSLGIDDLLLSVRFSEARAADGQLAAKDDSRAVWPVWLAYSDMVGKAEGTFDNSHGINPYRVIVGYREYDDPNWSDHPRQRYAFNDVGASSDAAGKHQWLSSTWDARRNSGQDYHLDEGSFSPNNQEMAFLYHSADSDWAGGYHFLRSAITGFEEGMPLIDPSKFDAAIFLDSRQWASLPGHNIGAATGQHTKPVHLLWTWFCWYLEKFSGHHRPLVFPAEGYSASEHISSEYGWRTHPITGDRKFHHGIDHGTSVGTPLLAPEDCVFVANGDDSGGYGIWAEYRSTINPARKWFFAHLSEYKAPTALIHQGDVIGVTGNSGGSTGPHLHTELEINGRRVDPKSWLLLSEWLPA